MCGIIGYVGTSPCLDLIMQGLKKLEYRGYDSAGIAVMDQSGIEIVKAEGKLSNLTPLIGRLPQAAKLAMGHTRWATHGKPSANNAHPHGRENVAIIHNGIVENYKELKIELLEEQRIFHSETDSEVIVHLLQKQMETETNFMLALRQVLNRLQGAYALGIFCLADPEAIYLVKHGSPLVVCKGNDGNLFASDAFALMEHGQNFFFLDDGEMARVTKDNVTFWSIDGEPVLKEPTFLRKVEIDAQMGQFRHFMIKEIHDQGAVVSSTINRLVDVEGRVDVKAVGIDNLDFSRIQRIHVVACGSAYHAGWSARYFFEPILKMPVEIELASEFRYRQPYIDKSTLVIAVTQSGETADTLASVKFAKTKGCQILSICNVEHSSIPRHSDGVLYMHAGPEIGVASTKAYVSMMLNIYLLGAAIAQSRGHSVGLDLTSLDSSLRLLPTLVQKAVALEKDLNEFAKSFFKENHCLFIGRGLSYIIACEGALKLKEISYIHAEAYAGGELKHGPIALIDKSMPVIAVAPLDEHHGKMLSNVEEVCARGGRVIGIGSADDHRFRSMCEHYIPCPQIEHSFLQAIISVIPLQLLAYHVAVHRGTDVDQPRNLAKSVTVE